MKPLFLVFWLALVLVRAGPAGAATVHEAVKAGDVEALRSILEANAEAIAATNSAGETPLHVAAAMTNPAMVEVLLAAKAPVDARDAGGDTPLQAVFGPLPAQIMTNTICQVGATRLMRIIVGRFVSEFDLTASETADLLTQVLVVPARGDAAKAEDAVKVVELLLAAGADPNARDSAGFTVIGYACMGPNTSLLRALLVPGANLNTRDTMGGLTPLLVASLLGNQPAMEALLDNGADAGACDAYGNTALRHAVTRRDKGMAKCLLDRRTPANPLADATQTALTDAVHVEAAEWVALLLDHGASLAVHSGDLGETALHTAVRTGNLAIIQLLLDRNAPIDATDNVGFTPLLNAAEDGHLEVAKLLANCGANLKARTKDDKSAFVLAAASTNVALVAWLLEKQGTDVLGTGEGSVALGNAAGNGRLSMVQFLLDQGVPANAPSLDAPALGVRMFPLHLAAIGPAAKSILSQSNIKGFRPARVGSTDDYVRIVSLLLASGAQVDEPGTEGRTSLNMAAAYSCLQTARVLLENKASVRSRAIKEGKTPLHQVASRGDGAIAELLLAHGAELESRDDSGFTPLRDAAACGNSAVVKVLLEHKASVRVRDRYQATPLHWAALTTSVATVALLLDAGADINAVDMAEQTPLHQAATAGHEAVVALLVARQADVTRLDADAYTATDRARTKGFAKIVTILGAGSATPPATLPEAPAIDLASLRAAAEKGDPDAQCRLAGTLISGPYNSRDPAQGVEWYVKAARQGSPEALYELGMLYYRGERVAQDLVKAYGHVLAAQKRLAAQGKAFDERQATAAVCIREKIPRAQKREAEREAQRLLREPATP